VIPTKRPVCTKPDPQETDPHKQITAGATTMSSTPSTARPKRTRTAGAEANHGSGSARSVTPASIRQVSAEQRHAMIADAAYRRAERRGFTTGDAVADWLESEKEVDALLRSAD
jgi:hypothetical protein